MHTCAREVPMSTLTRNGAHRRSAGPECRDRRLGHGRAGRFNSRGRQVPPFTQVSRFGNPLVNEVVIPPGLKDAFNASTPENDEVLAPFILDPQLPKLIKAGPAAGGTTINIPPPPRNALVAIFGTGIPAGLVPGFQNFSSTGFPHEYQRLNVSIPPSASPNRLGLLGGDHGSRTSITCNGDVVQAK